MKKITKLICGFLLVSSPILSAEDLEKHLPRPTTQKSLHESNGEENTEKLLTSVAPPATSTARLRTGGMGAWGCHYWESPYSIPSQTNSWESSS